MRYSTLRACLLSLAAFTLVQFPVCARADTLLGTQVRLTEIDNVVTSTATNTVMDPGVEFNGVIDRNVDVHDTSFDVIFDSSIDGLGTATHTTTLTELSSGVPSIIGATVDPSTTLVGFTSSRISFTATSVTLNFSNSGGLNSKHLTIDLQFAPVSSAPVPATLPAGLACLAVLPLARKLRRSVA